MIEFKSYLAVILVTQPHFCLYKSKKQKTDSPCERLTALSVFPINDSARVQLQITMPKYLGYYRIKIGFSCDSRHTPNFCVVVVNQKNKKPTVL
jgi:hypothetical protein